MTTKKSQKKLKQTKKTINKSQKKQNQTQKKTERENTAAVPPK